MTKISAKMVKKLRNSCFKGRAAKRKLVRPGAGQPLDHCSISASNQDRGFIFYSYLDVLGDFRTAVALTTAYLVLCFHFMSNFVHERFISVGTEHSGCTSRQNDAMSVHVTRHVLQAERQTGICL